VSDTALDTYLAEIAARGVDPRAAATVRALDRVIRDIGPDLESTVKYKILMYALRGDWRTWVCAIDATTKGVSLRFLYGVILDDPRGVLRAGSSVLKTWDFGFDEAVDPVVVGAYVTDAIAKYATYKADAPAILEASRAAAAAPRKPKVP
jgi:hypothetical protein